MKKIIAAFFVGVVLSSGAWYAYVWWQASCQALEFCGLMMGEAEFAEKLLAQAQDPSSETRRKTERTAVALIKTWMAIVDSTQRKYPLTEAKARCAAEYAKAEALINQWQTTGSNNAAHATPPAGAEHGR